MATPYLPSLLHTSAHVAYIHTCPCTRMCDIFFLSPLCVSLYSHTHTNTCTYEHAYAYTRTLKQPSVHKMEKVNRRKEDISTDYLGCRVREELEKGCHRDTLNKMSSNALVCAWIDYGGHCSNIYSNLKLESKILFFLIMFVSRSHTWSETM